MCWRKKVAVPSLLKTDCNSKPYLITTLVVFLLHLCAGGKVAVPSLLKTDCNSEPYLITTLVVFLLHLCAGEKSSSSFIVEKSRLQQ
jgi:hypothetical protein